MSPAYPAISPLCADHRVQDFECSSEIQTMWFRKYALNNISPSASSKVYVVPDGIDSKAVAAYYAWSMYAIDIGHLPKDQRRGYGNYPQPLVLLGQLGVSVNHEQRGLGRSMLQHVIFGTQDLSKTIGRRGLIIHAENINAVNFYRHCIQGFLSSPSDPNHLLLLNL